jgi:hypothetical protein
MRFSLTSFSLLALVISIAASGCSGEQGLVGFWRTETFRRTLPGRTHIFGSYQTVEFLKDGSFKMGNTINTDGDRRRFTVFSGTYTLIDTNHIRLEVASNVPGDTNKTPLTVRVRISGDELEMDKLSSSVVPETQKYRRARR